MYEHLVTFIEQYELDQVRCADARAVNGFVIMKSLHHDEIIIDGECYEPITFSVNARYVKDFGVVKEGETEIIGVEANWSNKMKDHE